MAARQEMKMSEEQLDWALTQIVEHHKSTRDVAAQLKITGKSLFDRTKHRTGVTPIELRRLRYTAHMTMEQLLHPTYPLG